MSKAVNERGEGISARSPRAYGLHSMHLFAAIALTVGLLLLLNFSQRSQLDRDLAQIHAKIQQQVARLQAEQASLQAELARVRSDAYVEYWARDDGKLVREGEVLIFPQRVTAAAATPPPRQLFPLETSPPKLENWQLWWALFFDQAPPATG